MSERTRRSGSTLSNLRWGICALLFLATTLNYLDRQSLAALKPIIGPKLGWGEADYGWINFAFQTAYAVAQPFAGRFADLVGVRWALALGLGVWSLAALAHAFVRSVVGFAVARFALGAGEAMNFPASLKAVAEWFPRRERALATGIFNSGSNVGVMFGIFAVWVAGTWGWPWAFVTIGTLGFLWLALWLLQYPRDYVAPDDSAGDEPDQDLATTRSRVQDETRSRAADRCSWTVLLRHREVWPFLITKFMTDPVWWFYLFWLPDFLVKHRGLDAAGAARFILVPYFAASAGSIGAGWLSSALIRRGWRISSARYLALAVCAACMPGAVLAQSTGHLWTAIILISLAAAGHQGWSANLYSMATDVFPSAVAGSVIGLGQTTGAIGGMLMTLLVGGILQARQDYTPIFLWAGFMHPLGWIVFRLIAGARMPMAELNPEADSTLSVPLLAGGAATLALGVTVAALIGVNWAALVLVAKESGAAAGLVATLGIALIGAALVYASFPRRRSGEVA